MQKGNSNNPYLDMCAAAGVSPEEVVRGLVNKGIGDYDSLMRAMQTGQVQHMSRQQFEQSKQRAVSWAQSNPGLCQELADKFRQGR
jgi:hypothetical protein